MRANGSTIFLDGSPEICWLIRVLSIELEVVSMAMVINYADKRVEIKIVYYGPAAAGKTTSLQYLASSLNVEVVDLDFRTEESETIVLCFSNLPLSSRSLANGA